MNGQMEGTYSSVIGYMIIVKWTNWTNEMDRYKYECIFYLSSGPGHIMWRAMSPT